MPAIANFPQAVPEIPVSNIEQAARYYTNVLGFAFDWGDDAGGIAGISQGACRMFLTTAPFRENRGNRAPVVIWLNLSSKQEVDELYLRWQQAGAKVVSPPEDKPWHLREFTVADLDNNQFRVFYDFSGELNPQT
jgi:predicted lactoylglutathione lyase